MSFARISETFADPVELVSAALYAALDGVLIDVQAERLPQILQRRCGAFVTLHKGGSLRGCMGTFWPFHRYSGREVVWSGLQAAFNDVRFPPLCRDELPETEAIVDLICDPERTSLEEVDTHSAVLAEFSGTQAVFLPHTEMLDWNRLVRLHGPGKLRLPKIFDDLDDIDRASGTRVLLRALIEELDKKEDFVLWAGRAERFSGPLQMQMRWPAPGE